MSNLHQVHRPIIIAHRGESYDAIENTLGAINLAWERGADGVEIDVRLSRDNEIVVIHDKNTKRVSGENHLVKSLTLKSLKKLDIRMPGENSPNEKIPLLREVLLTLSDREIIFIEIKCGTEIIPELKNVLKCSRLNSNQIKLIGFSIKKMATIKKYFSQYEVFLNKRICFEKIIHGKSSWDKLIMQIKKHSLDGLNLAYTRSLNSEVVKKFKFNKLKLYVWIINTPQKAHKMISISVDGFMSDRAGYIIEKVNEL
jgi:glycerophosphoryl diester phosphodiesterase